jgi:hypothetical protein
LISVYDKINVKQSLHYKEIEFQIFIIPPEGVWGQCPHYVKGVRGDPPEADAFL